MTSNNRFADLLGRSFIVGYFTFAVLIQCIRTYSQVKNELPSDLHGALRIASDLAVLIFLGLVIVTTLFRHEPLASPENLEPRVTAFLGTFLLGVLALFPQAELQPPALTVTGLSFVMLGGLLSSYVLLWLGRSFSIMAQARRLVTGGPYAVVRHPLYVAEEITTIGIVILHLSWQAVFIAAIHWLIQLRRMHNEESILRATFQEYDSYARCTPRIIPSLAAKVRSRSAS